MKVCAACCKELQQSSFSKKQWKLKQHERRCTDCIEAGREVQLIPPSSPKTNINNEKDSITLPKTSINDDTSPCWICLDEEPNEGGPPRRDCSCRGNAGFVHMSCITKYAEKKIKETNSVFKLSLDDLMKCINLWEICPNCGQTYQHEFAIDLADSALTFFANDGISGNPLTDNIQVMEALRMKIQAIRTMDCDDNLDMRRVAKKVAKKMLSLIESIKTKHGGKDQCPNLLGRREIYACHQLAFLSRMEETTLTDKEALQYFKRADKVSISIGMIKESKMCEPVITELESKIKGKQIHFIDTILDGQKRYNDHVKMGRGNDVTIISMGLRVASGLSLVNRDLEAERILINIYATSRRILGPAHDTTKEISNQLEKCKKKRYVRCIINSDGDVQVFRAIRYEDGGSTCVVKGPMTTKENRNSYDSYEGFTLDDMESEEGKIIKVESRNIFYFKGSIVECHGLKKAAHLNGKFGTVESSANSRYVVAFEEKNLDSAAVKPENLRIAFDLTVVNN